MQMRPWVEAMSRLAVRREWALELLGERRSIAILRGLVASANPDDRRLALSQLDRLPEWLDLLTTWLGQQPEEHLVLEALNRASRLTGPYAQLAFRTYLHREVQRALCGDSPADHLWALSLRVARWSREWTTLRSLRLDQADPLSALARVPEALRGFTRRIEAAGRVEPDLARLLEAWPDSTEAAPVPNDPVHWHRSSSMSRSRMSVARTDGASSLPTVPADPSDTKMPRAA